MTTRATVARFTYLFAANARTMLHYPSVPRGIRMTEDKCKPGPKACASITLLLLKNRQVRTEPHKRLTYYSPTITSSAHYTYYLGASACVQSGYGTRVDARVCRSDSSFALALGVAKTTKLSDSNLVALLTFGGREACALLIRNATARPSDQDPCTDRCR